MVATRVRSRPGGAAGVVAVATFRPSSAIGTLVAGSRPSITTAPAPPSPVTVHRAVAGGHLVRTPAGSDGQSSWTAVGSTANTRIPDPYWNAEASAGSSRSRRNATLTPCRSSTCSTRFAACGSGCSARKAATSACSCGRVRRGTGSTIADHQVRWEPGVQLVPALAHEPPGPHAVVAVGDAPPEQHGRVLGADVVGEGQGQRPVEQRGVAELRQRHQLASLVLRVVRRPVAGQAGLVLGLAAVGRHDRQGGGGHGGRHRRRVGQRGWRAARRACRTAAGSSPRLAEGADQRARSSPVRSSSPGGRLPAEALEGGRHQRPHVAAEALPGVALDEAIDPPQPVQQDLPHRQVGLVGEAPHEPGEGLGRQATGHHAGPRVVDQAVALGGRQRGQRRAGEAAEQGGVVLHAEEPVGAGVHDHDGVGRQRAAR